MLFQTQGLIIAFERLLTVDVRCEADSFPYGLEADLRRELLERQLWAVNRRQLWLSLVNANPACRRDNRKCGSRGSQP